MASKYVECVVEMWSALFAGFLCERQIGQASVSCIVPFSPALPPLLAISYTSINNAKWQNCKFYNHQVHICAKTEVYMGYQNSVFLDSEP